LKIIVTHPFCWPYVRRGTERNMDELTRYLTDAGHDVLTISTGPEAPREEETAGGRRILVRPIVPAWMARFRIKPTHAFLYGAWRSLRRLRADVVHSFYFTDALAASLTRRRHGGRVVLQLNGIAIPGVSAYRFLPPEAPVFRAAVRRADARIVCSGFIRELLHEHYGMDAHVIPPLVNVAGYEVGAGPPDGRPTILAVADFDVRRKGIRVLVRAFAAVKHRLPDAVLRLSGRLSPAVQSEVIDPLPDAVRRDVEILGLGRIEDVPGQYRTASVTVLPAMWEPSGTVMFESWACGTPVVATRHAGLPEFFASGVGVLFDPQTDGEETHNTDGLADAIVRAVELAGERGARSRCRAHAEQYSWSALGPRIEAVYRDAPP
jgi:glycosyltransferase involved in cell wall biosynthesis